MLRVKHGSFDNLPILTKDEVFQILDKPMHQLELSSDYYKAVFHSLKYPGADTEEKLLQLLDSSIEDSCVCLAKRKAIEILARHGCKRAIPSIRGYLKSNDPYLVENAAWALQKLGCRETSSINLIAELLDNPNQNRRLLIQSLSGMQAVSVLDKIKNLLHDPSTSPGVRGAVIVAIKKLSGDSQYIKELAKFLLLPNQNTRQCAVNDIIEAGEISLLDLILKTPVAPSFRMRALDVLWPENCLKFNELELLRCLDDLILDNPEKLSLANDFLGSQEDSFYIDQFFSTDFRRAYTALKVISNRKVDEIWPILYPKLGDMRVDYGALYFLMILFRVKDRWNQEQLQEIRGIILHALGKSWPAMIKFRPAAILALSKLFPSSSEEFLPQWINQYSTSFWACRYAALMVIDRILGMGKNKSFVEYLLVTREDSNRFVRAKSEELLFKYHCE